MDNIAKSWCVWFFLHILAFYYLASTRTLSCKRVHGSLRHSVTMWGKKILHPYDEECTWDMHDQRYKFRFVSIISQSMMWLINWETIYILFKRNATVGPKIWGPSPLCVKGPKPCPTKPNRRGRAMQFPEGPRTWPRTTSRPTSHKNAWRKWQIQYKSSLREKAANTLMRTPAPDKPILTPCYPAFPNHSDVWIDKTSNHPKQGKRDT